MNINSEEVVIIQSFSVALQIRNYADIIHVIEYKNVNFFGYIGIESICLIQLPCNTSFNILTQHKDDIDKVFEFLQLESTQERALQVACKVKAKKINLKCNKIYKTYLYGPKKQKIVNLSKTKDAFKNISDVNTPTILKSVSKKTAVIPNNTVSIFTKTDKRKYNISYDDSESETKSKDIVKWKNYSLTRRRHNRQNKLSLIYLSKLFHCNTSKLLTAYLLRATQMEYIIGNRSVSKSKLLSDYSNSDILKSIDAYLPPKLRHKSECIQRCLRKRKMETTTNVISDLSCRFSYRYVCYILHNSELIETIMKRKTKLRVERNVHSRITIKINDYLLNEDDDRYCRVLIEAMTKAHLVCTVDIVDTVFPEWSIWTIGAVDKKCYTSI